MKQYKVKRYYDAYEYVFVQADNKVEAIKKSEKMTFVVSDEIFQGTRINAEEV